MDPRTSEPTPAAKAENAARQAGDYLRAHNTDEIADDARAKVEEIAGTVREKAGEVGGQASEKISSAMSSTGQQITNLAQTVRERAPEGQVGEIATATADALDRSGRYLQEQDLDGLRRDVEQIIKRYPVQSLLVGAGVSFLFARSMRR